MSFGVFIGRCLQLLKGHYRGLPKPAAAGWMEALARASHLNGSSTRLHKETVLCRIYKSGPAPVGDSQ